MFTCLIYVVALSVPICSRALWQEGLPFFKRTKTLSSSGNDSDFILLAAFFVSVIR